MPGLPRILLALVLTGCSLAARGPPRVHNPKAIGLAPWRPAAPSRRGRMAAEVDAFLGLSRSARIAQVIPDHARACLPSAGGALSTDAQRAIAAGVGALAESPLGAWLIGEAAARMVLICHDPNTDLAGYYRAQMRLIGLFQQLPDPARIMFLAHELAHVPQHPRFSNDLRFGAHGVLVVHRIREAAAEAVATRILWQLRARGHVGPWQHKLASAYGDIASAFARAMDGAGDGAELRARAPRSISGSPARAGCRATTRACSGSSPRPRTTARASSTHAPPERRFPARHRLVRRRHLPAAGRGLPLTDAYYAHALSPANAARLEAILARAGDARALPRARHGRASDPAAANSGTA